LITLEEQFLEAREEARVQALRVLQEAAPKDWRAAAEWLRLAHRNEYSPKADISLESIKPGQEVIVDVVTLDRLQGSYTLLLEQMNAVKKLLYNEQEQPVQDPAHQTELIQSATDASAKIPPMWLLACDGVEVDVHLVLARAHKVFPEVAVSDRVASHSGRYVSDPYREKQSFFFQRQRILIPPHIYRFFGSCVHKCLQQWLGYSVISSRTYPSLYIL
jgi:hypothetical protein